MTKKIQNIKNSIVWSLYGRILKPFLIKFGGGFFITYSSRLKLSARNFLKKRINVATWELKRLKVLQYLDNFDNRQLKVKTKKSLIVKINHRNIDLT